jgi:hypothetical protein
MAAAAIAAAATIAACGSSSPKPSSASSSGGHPAQSEIRQAQQDATRFAVCMRSHGVPSFPDPTSPHEFKASLSPESALVRSPSFQSAYTACRHLLPNGGRPNQSTTHSRARIAAALAFARCIRSHGLPNFPDPTSTGDITPEILANAGINLHQPAVQQAGDACVGVTHGFMTKAIIARFIAGH